MSDQQSSLPARNQGPIVRNPATGCTAQLGTELIPTGFEHTEWCGCLIPRTDEQWKSLSDSVKRAIEEKIVDQDKASIAFAELLLGVGLLSDLGASLGHEGR
ncbi:hypothetical protein F5Y00DRAFT_258199 [Daldinia vernicosa]|uniref:uncharacterized protein n=1 Tax=Daldinia vernicosa TaxID=114800 RepID=UPI002008BA82|nr:uncharacterized protein F5Y00DRAFT_258199 [Daldinia vernicosa]KAI0852943.1 hypothetical protein F5Y00DRAFT_258199 [Daldinia vernicosa]